MVTIVACSPDDEQKGVIESRSSGASPNGGYSSTELIGDASAMESRDFVDPFDCREVLPHAAASVGGAVAVKNGRGGWSEVDKVTLPTCGR